METTTKVIPVQPVSPQAHKPQETKSVQFLLFDGKNYANFASLKEARDYRKKFSELSKEKLSIWKMTLLKIN